MRESKFKLTCSITPAGIRDATAILQRRRSHTNYILPGKPTGVSRQTQICVGWWTDFLIDVVLNEMNWITDVDNNEISPCNVVHVASRSQHAFETSANEAIIDDGVFKQVISSRPRGAGNRNPMGAVSYDVPHCYINGWRGYVNNVVSVPGGPAIDDHVAGAAVNSV